MKEKERERKRERGREGGRESSLGGVGGQLDSPVVVSATVGEVTKAEAAAAAAATRKGGEGGLRMTNPTTG